MASGPEAKEEQKPKTQWSTRIAQAAESGHVIECKAMSNEWLNHERITFILSRFPFRAQDWLTNPSTATDAESLLRRSGANSEQQQHDRTPTCTSHTLCFEKQYSTAACPIVIQRGLFTRDLPVATGAAVTQVNGKDKSG